MDETSFANRPGGRDDTGRTAMRLATAALTLASAAAFTIPQFATAAQLDMALLQAGLFKGELARTLAFACLPAALGALATGLRLRADGAPLASALVPAGFVAAGFAALAMSTRVADAAAAHLCSASGFGLLALALYGLGLCSLCVPAETAPRAQKAREAVPVRLRPGIAHPGSADRADDVPDIALAA
jgi:hypothetical protein